MKGRDSKNLLITQPVRRDPTVLPTIDGNKCVEAMVLDARSVTRKYNATEEIICTVFLALKQGRYPVWGESAWARSRSRQPPLGTQA